MPPRLVSRVVVLLSFARLAACGGEVDQSFPGESGVASASDGTAAASGLDSGAASPTTAFGSAAGFDCVLQPVLGLPCTSTASLCGPTDSSPAPAASPCLVPVWQCVDREWELLPPLVCDGGASTDAGELGDATPPGCEACDGNLCIATTTGATTTHHCEPSPVGCTGLAPSCNCAGALCGDGCTCVGTSAAGVVACACPGS